MKKYVKKRILFLITLLFLLILLSQRAQAHPPSSMALEYDYSTQTLNVTISHSVGDPNSHYVESVEILKNDVESITTDYTSQPSTSTISYTYDISASDGDNFEVTATCNQFGSITEEIQVDEPSPDQIILEVTPTISTISENGIQIFDISVFAGGEPLDDVTFGIDVVYGSFSGPQRTGQGEFNFTYYAPDVTKKLTETIDIEASKDGYDDADSKLKFTITDSAEPTETCPTLDGIIESGEYEFSASFSGGEFVIHWRVENDTIIMAMEGKTTGWVAIGIEPSDKMKDADMIFGWVSDSGVASVLDCFSTGTFGPHPPDTELGGTSDILCYGGTESGGKTIIEFKRLLSTGDSKDKDIPSEGEITIIWATGPDDDFESQHGGSSDNRGYGKVDIGTGEYEEIEIPAFWIFHATLMIVGFILMLLGIIIAKVFKKKKWWLKTHKILGVLGAIFSIAGLLMAFIMVSMGSGEHFHVPHAYLGILAMIFAILAPSLGFAQFKVKKNKSKIRFTHRWVGRIAIVLMLLNIISGLLLVEII
ncbi:MAG: hypothetical protein JSW00_11420 [Thermoplasmata archaeon]|nr:MAG: hypothetical protein JSW00_11420 [Thermoplasmata archaeon]